jgi:hypothetical protein
MAEPMKKNVLAPLCLLFTASMSFAQSGKPTLEQTIDYIQANHPQNIEYKVTQTLDNAVFLNSGGDITGIKYAFDGSKVHVTYRYATWTNQVSAEGITPRKAGRDDTFDVVFDLKEIEALAAGAHNSFGMIEYSAATEGGGPLFLIFKAANRKSLIKQYTNGELKNVPEVWIPFNIDPVGTDHRAMHEAPNTQLYKAFEHLRKLSGAPEPISF